MTIMKENDSLGAVPIKNPRPSYFDETHKIKPGDFDEALKKIKKQRRLRENKLFFLL